MVSFGVAAVIVLCTLAPLDKNGFVDQKRYMFIRGIIFMCRIGG